MYAISDGLDTELMRPGLDFVVPQKHVRVINNTKPNGNATINAVQYVNGKTCLNVTYDNVAYKARVSFGYDFDASDYFIENFRYEGLPLMDPGAKIKVYTNKHGSIKPEFAEDLTAEMAEILDRIKTIPEPEIWVYQAQLLKNGRIVWLERDEAMPYDTRAAVRNDDADKSHAEHYVILHHLRVVYLG